MNLAVGLASTARTQKIIAFRWRCPPTRRDFFRRAASGDPTAAFAPFGPEIDDPIGAFDHVEIVLDHQHRVAAIDQPVEHAQQLPDVVEVQAGSRLVEDVKRFAGIDAGQFGGQLDAVELRRRTSVVDDWPSVRP